MIQFFFPIQFGNLCSFNLGKEADWLEIHIFFFSIVDFIHVHFNLVTSDINNNHHTINNKWHFFSDFITSLLCYVSIAVVAKKGTNVSAAAKIAIMQYPTQWCAGSVNNDNNDASNDELDDDGVDDQKPRWIRAVCFSPFVQYGSTIIFRRWW